MKIQGPWTNSDMPKNFRAGYIVKCIEKLFASIDDSITNPKDFLIIKRNSQKNFFNLDGKSSHRACEAVLSFAKKGV